MILKNRMLNVKQTIFRCNISNHNRSSSLIEMKYKFQAWLFHTAVNKYLKYMDTQTLKYAN